MSHETRQGAVEEPEGEASAGAPGDIYASDDEFDTTQPRLRAIRRLAPHKDETAVSAQLGGAQIVDRPPETLEPDEDAVAAGEPNDAIETVAVAPDVAAAETAEVTEDAAPDVVAPVVDDPSDEAVDASDDAADVVWEPAAREAETEAGGTAAGEDGEPHAGTRAPDGVPHEATHAEPDESVAAVADDSREAVSPARYGEAPATVGADALAQDGIGEDELEFATSGAAGSDGVTASIAEPIAEPPAYAQPAAYGEKAAKTRPARQAPAFEDAAETAGAATPSPPQRARGAPIPSIPRTKSRPVPQGGAPESESAARHRERRSRPASMDVSGVHSKVPPDYWLDADPLEEMRQSLGLRGARPITREAGKPLPKPSRFKRAPMWQSFLVMMAVLVVVALCVGGMVAFAANSLQQRPAQTTPVPAGATSPAAATQSPAH